MESSHRASSVRAGKATTTLVVLHPSSDRVVDQWNSEHWFRCKVSDEKPRPR